MHLPSVSKKENYKLFQTFQSPEKHLVRGFEIEDQKLSKEKAHFQSMSLLTKIPVMTLFLQLSYLLE